MNVIFGGSKILGGLYTSFQVQHKLVGCLVGAVSGRGASKKASGGTRNPKQAKGQNRGIKYSDGSTVYPNDIIVHKQSRLWFHPGLNVRLAGRMNLVARKVGKVVITCEVPDLNYKNFTVQKYYSGREGQQFYKKYFHVIPLPQHTRFKCINQI